MASAWTTVAAASAVVGAGLALATWAGRRRRIRRLAEAQALEEWRRRGLIPGAGGPPESPGKACSNP